MMMMMKKLVVVVMMMKLVGPKCQHENVRGMLKVVAEKRARQTQTLGARYVLPL